MTQTIETAAATARTGRGGPVIVGTMVVALLIAVGMGALAISRGLGLREARLARTPDENMAGLALPEFTLTDQDGRTISNKDFAGKVVVVEFFFTNCPFVCPMLTRAVLDLQKQLAGAGVRFLSISVDPEHDTPQRLREHALALGAELSTWTFATGDAETVRRISEKGFTLGLEDDPSRTVTLGDGTVMHNIAHSSKLVVVGADGRALTMGSGLEPAEVARLAERARKAAAAARTR